MRAAAVGNLKAMGLSVSEAAAQIATALQVQFDLVANEEIRYLRMSRFTVRETNRFDFAIVFDNGRPGQDAVDAMNDLRMAVRSLTDQGIALDVLYDNTVNDDSQRLTILLLRVSKLA